MAGSIKGYLNGLQHIGIPTDNMEATVQFYEKIGFEQTLFTVNEAENMRVAFLQLNTLMLEIFEKSGMRESEGAIDHIAIDVLDIDKVYRIINEEKLNTKNDSIHFLPFWDNGIKYFIIKGPNGESIEFSQYL